MWVFGDQTAVLKGGHRGWPEHLQDLLLPYPVVSFASSDLDGFVATCRRFAQVLSLHAGEVEHTRPTFVLACSDRDGFYDRLSPVDLVGGLNQVLAHLDALGLEPGDGGDLVLVGPPPRDLTENGYRKYDRWVRRALGSLSRTLAESELPASERVRLLELPTPPAGYVSSPNSVRSLKWLAEQVATVVRQP